MREGAAYCVRRGTRCPRDEEMGAARCSRWMDQDHVMVVMMVGSEFQASFKFAIGLKTVTPDEVIILYSYNVPPLNNYNYLFDFFLLTLIFKYSAVTTSMLVSLP